MEDDAPRPDDRGLDTTGDAAEPLPLPPTPAELEQAEGLIRQANLAKIRGDKGLYERLVHEASTIAPGSSTVQEAVGDAYLATKQVRKAKDAFQLAVKLDPSNASAERKFGEAVLSVQLALDPMFATIPEDDSVASGKAGLIMSFLIPGLGQLANGDNAKGYPMLGGWLLGVVGSLAVPQGLAGLATVIGVKGPAFNPIVLIPVLLAFGCWIWSIGDAGSRNKRFERKPIIHPVPPVDKDFEL